MIRRDLCMILLAASFATAACGSAQRRPASNDEVTTRMTASDERALDQQYQPDGPRDPGAQPDDLTGAVDRCVQAMGAPASESDPREIAVACADLFEQSACRDVHRRAAELARDTAVATIFEQCAREYCPVFDPTHAPASCDAMDNLPDQAQAAWSQLRAAIWRLELDTRHHERLIR